MENETIRHSMAKFVELFPINSRSTYPAANRLRGFMLFETLVQRLGIIFHFNLITRVYGLFSLIFSSLGLYTPPPLFLISLSSCSILLFISFVIAAFAISLESFDSISCAFYFFAVLYFPCTVQFFCIVVDLAKIPYKHSAYVGPSCKHTLTTYDKMETLIGFLDSTCIFFICSVRPALAYTI